MSNMSRSDAVKVSAVAETFAPIGPGLSSRRRKGERLVTALIFSAAAAVITLSGTAAFAGPTADGNTPDFYAIQQGLPYAGAPATIMPAHETIMPKRRPVHRQFLRGHQRVTLAGHRG